MKSPGSLRKLWLSKEKLCLLAQWILSKQRKPKGKARRSRKNYSGGNIEGLVLFSLEKTRLVRMVRQKKTTPPCHAEYSGKSRARAQGEYTLAGRKSFPATGTGMDWRHLPTTRRKLSGRQSKHRTDRHHPAVTAAAPWARSAQCFATPRKGTRSAAGERERAQLWVRETHLLED